MKVLLIHQNSPGQLRHLAAHLVRQPGVEVLAIGRENAPGMEGIRLLRYRPHRAPSKQIHPYVFSFEEAVLHGQQVLRLLLELKSQGYKPDVVVAHPGWGETLYVKLAFPDTKLIHYTEYYYHLEGADTGFDPEFPITLENAALVSTRNALHLFNIEQCDLGIAPTHWQKSLYPAVYHDKIRVIHEGVDINRLAPDPAAFLEFPNGKKLRPGDPVVTYVARNLEPYRGFHHFMRALPKLLKAHPDCHVLVVGGDDVSYGDRPDGASNWREKMLRENPVDPERVHFSGKVSYDLYRCILQVSAVHVYLTYPFVLSWSVLEAMACGCLLVASDTAPVREIIRHGENGWLFDFFDHNALVEHVLRALSAPPEAAVLRSNARQSAQAYSTERGIAGYVKCIGHVLGANPATPEFEGG
ncbi:MAG: glycosyltransferase family 4 protein [Azoarcus sp.]|jgi:glycosyltransferase involved in cell wall biosynthesis|nr:glycosyltransferase family 4 protein [Azoarcus sp.]